MQNLKIEKLKSLGK